MTFEDGAIDSRSQSEIVGIHDESAHAESLAGRATGGRGVLYDVVSCHSGGG